MILTLHYLANHFLKYGTPTVKHSVLVTENYAKASEKTGNQTSIL
jgi:hypothetical protein